MVCTTAGSVAALAAAARSFCTTGSGVPAGTNSADHCANCTGWPAPFRLGSSGSEVSGLSPQCASARSLPALMCESTLAGPVDSASTCPPSSASTAGPAPA